MRYDGFYKAIQCTNDYCMLVWKLRSIWREMMDYQKSHPEKVYYTRSRFFTFTEEGSSEESWVSLDEYERREDYDKWMKAVREDPELVRLMEEWFPKWDALIVPGSRKGEVWTEVVKLRVEFK